MNNRTRSGPGEHQVAIGPTMRDALGRIRRMAVTLTSRAFWQVAGHVLPDKTRETVNVEAFTGIGFYARPAAGNRAEAVVIYPGGASQPIIIATRDEDARKAIAAGIAAGETAVFNPSAIILIKADGTIEIRSGSGTALNLATKQDLDILRAAIASAAIAVGAAGAAAINAAADTAYNILFPGQAWPRGTKKLKGE